MEHEASKRKELPSGLIFNLALYAWKKQIVFPLRPSNLLWCPTLQKAFRQSPKKGAEHWCD